MKRKHLLLILLLAIIGGIIFLLSHDFSSLFVQGFGLTMAILTGLWILSLIIKDASIIDIYWGIGFVVIAWLYHFKTGIYLTPRNLVFLVMVSLWGLRLGGYLAMRNLGKGEDFRYQAWRKEHGKNWWWVSFLRVFLLQGVLLWIISSVYVPVLDVRAGIGTMEIIGILLWLIGFFFEVVGDWQMARFKSNPKNNGKVMDRGLWKFTRHPNYFGDALLWWGYFCFALAHPQGWHFFFCPLLMSFLLVRVSGAAMLERTLKETKPGYQEYIRRTSVFIPRPPKD